MQRTLRRKSFRNALWLAAGGKCQSCGEELPAAWHADHIVPWSVSRRTNVHEMQALCPACNLRKGATVYRDHQAKVKKAAEDIRKGIPIRKIVPSVTPGGGKSAIPVILANELVGHGYDKVAVIVPRKALQLQAEQAFTSTFAAQIGCRHEIRQSTNDVDPSRGLAGFVTTYQAVGRDGGALLAEEFKRNRYILVLDEPHHVKDGDSWHRALAPLVERAKLLVLMSGTFQRSDNEPVAFVDYVTRDGQHVMDMSDANGRRVIRYTRRDALLERAILPLTFELHNGGVEYISPDGEERMLDSLADAKDSAGHAIFAAISTDYAHALLDNCVADWERYRRFNPRAKLLVVAANQRLARQYLKHLKGRAFRSEIATSDETDAAMEAIAKFKQHGSSAIDCLVTVAMAYEGLDVPSISHIACLTHIRATPWIEQMFNRATRVDRDGPRYEEQRAIIYAPDDPLMIQTIEAIKAEQDAAAKVAEEPDAAGKVGNGDVQIDEEKGYITPIRSWKLNGRAFDMDGNAAEAEEYARLSQAIAATGAPITVLEFRSLMQAYNATPAPPTPEPGRATPSQKEAALRDQIEAFCRRNDQSRGWDWGTTNKLVMNEFRTRRADMTYDQLCRVIAWLNRNYGEVVA